MSAAGHKDDFYAAFVCTAQRIEVPLRDLELRVEQGAIDIDG